MTCIRDRRAATAGGVVLLVWLAVMLSGGTADRANAAAPTDSRVTCMATVCTDPHHTATRRPTIPPTTATTAPDPVIRPAGPAQTVRDRAAHRRHHRPTWRPWWRFHATAAGVSPLTRSWTGVRPFGKAWA